MELSLKQYESIQEYLDDKMMPEQEKQFMDEVNSNPLIQEYLQFELELRQNLQLFSRNKITSESEADITKEFDDTLYINKLIERTGNEWLNAKKTIPVIEPKGAIDVTERIRVKTISKHLWFKIAAAVFLVFTVAGIIWFTANHKIPQSIVTIRQRVDSAVNKNDTKTGVTITKPQDSLTKKTTVEDANFAALFKTFYKKDAVPEQKPIFLAEALFDYENANYSTLINLDLTRVSSIRGLPDGDINNIKNVNEIGNYYRGISSIETGQYNRATIDLQWVIDNAANKQLLTKARWYQALLYIKKGNVTKALPLLASIANSNATFYNRQAKELLKQLNL